MRFLVDSNVLIRLLTADNPCHEQCVESLSTLHRDGHEACICAQIMIESWSVATRPMANNGLGLSPAEWSARAQAALKTLRLLPEPPDVYDHWVRLATSYAVQGKQVHDARIVALMLAHDVVHLLTLNGSDFKRFAEIHTLSPLDAPTHLP